MRTAIRALGRRVWRRAYSELARGKSVYCMMCGWKGRGFMTGNICPNCDSMARHRLIPYSLYHFGLDFNRAALLHAGPNFEEVGFVLDRFVPGRYLRLDIEPSSIVNLEGDLCDIPLPEAAIRYVLIWHVLEHIGNDGGAISELHRVLEPGGKVLVSVPITPPGRAETFEDASIPRHRYSEVYGHPDHVRACGLDYGGRFEERGFEVEVLTVQGDVAAAEKTFFGLSDSHVVWCCAKA